MPTLAHLGRGGLEAVGNTLLGYAAWAWLLARHPAATIAPTALLVPGSDGGAQPGGRPSSMPALEARLPPP